jgi:type III restriction enzyme
MSEPTFIERPILNSPHAHPGRHWELSDGRPTDRIIDRRRPSDLITPVPKPEKRRGRGKEQGAFALDAGDDLSTAGQEHTTSRIIKEIPDRDALEVRFPRLEGCRVGPPEDRVSAAFITPDSVLVLSPDLVDPSGTRNKSLIGEGVDLNVQHLADTRDSTVLMHLTKRLIYRKCRDPGEDPKLHPFGKLKRVAKQWLDGGYLCCTGETYRTQVLHREIADMAVERIAAAITLGHAEDKPVKPVLDPYNPIGSTDHVSFTTSKALRWQTDPRKCHVNRVICDSDREAGLCRVAEAHSRVVAYVENQGLGLEAPHRLGSAPKRYLPDFVVQVDDGRGPADPLNLTVEVKGYRGEDAKEKADPMRAHWVPGVNNLGRHGRRAFAEFTAVYAIGAGFRGLVGSLPSPVQPLAA